MYLSNAEKTSLILNAGSNIRLIDAAIKRIEKNAIKQFKNRLSNDKNFIDIDDYDILTEQRDSNGVRRYDAKNSEEGFVMIPNKDGFWCPYLDNKKS